MSIPESDGLYNKLRLAERICQLYSMRRAVDWVTKPAPLLELILHGPVMPDRKTDVAVLCMWLRGAALDKREARELLYLWVARHEIPVRGVEVDKFLDAAYTDTLGKRVVGHLLASTRTELLVEKDVRLRGLNRSASTLYGAVIDLERKAERGEYMPFETDVATLAQASALSRPTVVSSLKALETAGVIYWNPGHRMKRSVIQRRKGLK